MLPPIDPAVLQSNPHFQKLYTHLATTVLNPDGSTKYRPAGAEEDALRKELHAAQLAAAKREIICTSLARVSHHSAELLDDLQEAISVVAASLSAPLAAEDRTLLQPDIDYFLTNIHPISLALSASLQDTATSLSQSVSPTSPPSIPLLSAHLSARATTSPSLPVQRAALPPLATDLFTTHRTLLTTLIRALEQILHGTVARALRAKTDHLATVAESLDAKLRLLNHTAQSQVYSPTAVAALENYARSVEERRQQLCERKRQATWLLEGYERVGKGEMQALAKRYEELNVEGREVREGVRRLRGNREDGS